MVMLGLAIAPYITESIHIMTNPTLTSTRTIVENAQRKLLLLSWSSNSNHILRELLA